MAKKEYPPPLKGVKVANFCWIGVGPMTIRYLGYFGATVVRVESHRRPCLIRIMTPYKDGIPGVDRNTWFPNLNSSSYSLSIDINTPKGRWSTTAPASWARRGPMLHI